MKIPVYQYLFDLNAGFDQVIRSLDALARYDAFHRREIERFRALSKEARAATNSYLAGALERAETDEAGRRFGRRHLREQREE